MTSHAGSDPTEAAAKALASREPMRSATEWENLHEFERSGFRESARAALVAAQGAAPQAEALPETGNELRDEDGDLISSGKHLRILQQGMYVCDTCTNMLGLNVRWDHAIKRDDHAPVLPSSTESPVEPFKTWFACWWKNEPNAIAESNAQSAFYAGWDARGLPSSGVDEDKLAEVINAALDKWEGLEPSVVFVARAVTAWLKDEAQS